MEACVSQLGFFLSIKDQISSSLIKSKIVILNLIITRSEKLILIRLAPFNILCKWGWEIWNTRANARSLNSPLLILLRIYIRSRDVNSSKERPVDGISDIKQK